MPYLGPGIDNGYRSRFIYTATAGQTSFSGGDSQGITLTYTDSEYLDVYQNGVLLVPGDDYAATTGTTVVLVQGASLNDKVEMIQYQAFGVADTVSRADGGAFGGNIASSGTVTATGGLIIGNGTNIGSVGDTDAISIASNGVVTFSQTPVGDNGGTVVQIKNVQTGAKSSGTTVIPLDDSIPQKTEGIEVMTLAITPTATDTRLKIEVQIYMANDSGDDHIVALFQDGTANALAAGINFQVTVNGCTEHSFSHNMAAGTTSATTFKVRLGCDSSGTTTFNGFGNARKLGGTMASSITITEYSV